jgi:hypothetical protein
MSKKTSSRKSREFEGREGGRSSKKVEKDREKAKELVEG